MLNLNVYNMNNLISLLDQSFRNEIRTEISIGVSDIYKVREKAEDMIQRMVRKFKNDLTWQRTNLPTDGVEDTKVEAILNHLLTYSKECKDDLITDLQDKLAEKVQDKLDDYISDNVLCQTLQDIVFDNTDVSGDAYDWVEKTIKTEMDKLKAIDKHLEAEDADIHSGHIDTM
jgi:ABC-type antimicrobial peptide transport system permease subunit